MEASTLDGSVDIWERYYRSLSESYLFPNEYVVRTFLGRYPGLKMEQAYKGSSVCDVSCGDGRNLVLLHKLGLELSATEISQDICCITREKLDAQGAGIAVDLRPGSNRSIPFADNTFDYMLSWNSCYYMETETSRMQEHVAEFARTLKPGGYFICSVPSPGCFSLIGAEELGNHLIRINTDSKWNMLNGSIYYRFDSFDHIEDVFGEHFMEFSRCLIRDDCFGIPLEYFIFVCRKR